MSANCIKYLVSGLLWMCCTFNFSQIHQFRNITTEDGLPSSECYKIIQDKKGYIWISTDAGVCKYNGKEFKTFTTADGLPSNTIFEITEDRYGRIWGGCFHGGIFYILNDKVHTIKANKYLIDESNRNKELIRKIILDDKNVLHVGTTVNYYKIYPDNNYGVVEDYPEEDTSFTYLKLINDDLLFSRIIEMNGRNTEYTKHIIDIKGKKYILYPGYGSRRALIPHYHAAISPFNHIVFALGTTLGYFDFQKVTYYEYPDNIINLHYDHNGNLWVGFFKSGYKMYPKGDLSASSIDGLNGNACGGFLHDREGGIWINTLDKGVFYSPNIDIISFEELHGKNIPAVDAMNDQVYICSADDEITQVQNNKLHLLIAINNHIKSEKIYFYDIQGKMYKTGGKTVNFDEKGNYSGIKGINYRDFPNINQLTQASDSVWSINHEDLSAVVNDHIVSQHSLPSRGFCLYAHETEGLMIGCMNGLYKYHNGRFKKIYLNDTEENIRISFITKDVEKNLILSTRGNGIFIRKYDRWININQSHGLSSNLCYHIYCSPDSSYYVSTNKGMSIIRIKNNIVQIQSINIANGITANEVNMVAEYNGYIYLATENGICYYPKKSKIFNSTQPALLIRNITMNNTALINKTSYPYSQNDLYFNCDVLSYQSPKSNQLKYQLIPVDKEPKYSNDFDVHYDNLPAGNYTLTIQGVNNNRVEGYPAVYKFTIRPALWTTWWFILGSITILGLILYVIIKKRIEYLRKREEEKNVLKEKIVEYHYTALRAQMNPHFIFNVINSIQLYVLNNQPKEAYNYLSKFSKLIRRVLENSKQKLITLADELETLELYMELEKIRLEGNIIFNVKIDPSIDKEKLLVPSMIIQPVLENSVWHGIVPLNGSRTGKIDLSIQHRTESLLITIRDNGIGINLSKTKTHESFGLNLIRDRLSLLNGPTGIEIANLLDNKNQIQGVEVTILLPLIRNT